MSDVINATDANFESEVLNAQGPVVVDFSATWCGPCKKLEPIVTELAADFGDKVKVVKVDVDQAPQAAARFSVLSVPTVLVMKDGAVKDQVVGLVSKQALTDRVNQVL